MVQAAAGAVLGAFGSQTRRQPRERRQLESATPAIMAAPNTRSANRALKNAREERLMELLMQPEVLGMVMAVGGLILSNQIPFSDDPEKNAMLQSVSSIMTVAMGMGYAGVGDLTGMSVAIAAGGASIIGSILGGEGGLININTPSPGRFAEVLQFLNPFYSGGQL